MSRKTESTPAASTGNSSTLMLLMILNLIAVLAVIAILLNRDSNPGMRGLSNKETIVIDRVGNFALNDGRVNMDLISLQGQSPTTAQKLSVPQQGFLKCYADMGQLMKQMIERGLIEATPRTDGESEEGPAIGE